MTTYQTTIIFPTFPTKLETIKWSKNLEEECFIKEGSHTHIKLSWKRMATVPSTLLDQAIFITTEG